MTEQATQRTNIPIAERIAAKMNAIAGEPGEVEAEEATDAPEAEASGEPTETPLEQVTTEAAAPVAEETEEQKAVRAERAKRAELFEEKLKGAREKRQAQRLAEKAREERRAAENDRKAAAAERAKYEGLKEGTFKQTLEALGRDPRQAWEEMNREAIEGSTPEAQAKRREEALKRELDEKLTPLQQELKDLREREAKWAAQAHETAMVTSYQREAVDPVYADLRTEYDDATLMEYVRHYDKNPTELHAHAQEYGVRLTDPANGFTMREILDVLKSAQDAHERAKQARRAAIAPPGPQSAQPSVNGTAPRRNAGTAVGNDLAAQRASAKAEAPGLSPRERMRLRAAEEIRRSGGR